MALERNPAWKPKSGEAAESEPDETQQMLRRLWIASLLTLPVFVLAMAHLTAPSPSFFPEVMQMDGKVPLCFQAAAVIIVLVIAGQWLEARAHGQTDSVISNALRLRKTGLG